MKIVLSMLLAVALLLMAVPVGAIPVAAATGNTAEFAGGNGTAEDPYLITTVDQLDNVRYHLDAHFRIMNNLDLTSAVAVGGDYDSGGRGWTPISTYDTPFTGTFDGDGHTIFGLRIDIPTDYGTASNIYAGLFAYNNGTIEGLSVEGSVSVKRNHDTTVYAGGIVGCNMGTVRNCHNAVTVTANTSYRDEANVGGIAGYNSEGTIEQCYNTAAIKSIAYDDYAYAGGICGYSYGGLFRNCYNVGAITAKQTGSYCNAFAGGIAGSQHSSSGITNCYNKGIISAEKRYGSTYSQAIAVSGSCSNCYYLEGTGTANGGAVALTETQMRKQAAFVGFDFDTIWTMDGSGEYSYPILRFFAASIPSKADDFAGGSGTAEDPYLIATVDQLDNVRYYMDAHFKLVCDLDLTEAVAVGGIYDHNGRGWTPIGQESIASVKKFTGVFDGDGHSISGLRIDIPSTYESQNIYAGLFAYNAGTIERLSVEGSVTAKRGSSDVYAGGIVGYNTGTIEQCYNTAAIKSITQGGNSSAGGICGYSSGDGIIRNCYNVGAITAKQTSSSHVSNPDSYAGGIAGYYVYASGSAITNCYNVGAITAEHAYYSGKAHRAAITSSGSYSNCYYLEGTGTANGGAVALTETQMRKQAAFVGFDFDTVWTIKGQWDYEYPELQCFVTTEEGNTQDFAGGYGTAEDPYLISTPKHLDNVRNYLSAHFKLINDIEFTDADFAADGDFYNNGIGWVPIGGYVSPKTFTGTLDGNNHKIIGLKIKSDNWAVDKVYYLGLFANLAGVVHNLTFDKGGISLTRTTNGSIFDFECYIGTLAGCASGAYIKNVQSALFSINVDGGRVTGSAGGIVGYSINSHVECCNNASDISAQAPTNLGGIVGKTDGDNLTISMCYNTGNISNTNTGTDLGGILGEASSHTYKGGSTTIIDCYNSGTITSGYRVGGISGFAYETTISNCYNVGILDARDVNSIAAGWTHSGSLVVSNSYYSIGNGDQTEGSTPLSDMQMQSNLSYSGFDFDTTWTMGGDPDYPYPELQVFALSGKLDIRGDVAYLSTVEPDLNQINRVDDTFTYEWLIDGVVVGTGDSYVLKAGDIGKALYCKVTGTKEHNMGTLYSTEVIVSKAVQLDQPIVPELLMLDDNSFEITTNSNQEYSIDNVNWQSSGMFDNLDPNQDYTVYSRILENDLYLLGESAPVLNVTTDRRPLYGTVSLVGTSRFGDTLTVDVSGVMPENATYTYEWKANGIVVGTGSTYKIAQDDIGKNITLSVKGNGDFIGTLTSASVTATKATVQLPNAPTIEETTNTTVKLIEKVNYEYSKDGAIWQDSPLFEGLSAATEYTFYQRVKETETTFASKSSSGTKVTTLKNNVAAPEKPVVEKVTNTTVTLKLLTGYEYSLDGLAWQKSNVFTGLSPNTEYSFCQRIAENKTNYASAQSGYTIVVTLKNTVAAPGAPKIEKATATSVTLVNTAGYEYSIDGKIWQTNNVFTGLTTLKTYTFYQRIKETNTDYTSATSAGTSFKVKYVADAPAAPTLTEKTNNKIAVAVQTGYEYSINKTTWTTTGVFTGLQPNQAYTVYCRIPETDTHYASAISNALTVTTLKNTVSAPSAPVLSSKTDVSVTLVANSTYEYSKDGVAWQKANVFTGLSPNTEYTFYQRKAETNTAYVSKKSDGLKVRTNKKTVAAPAAPILAEKTATSVTLTKVNGYEYSKDGTNWQSDNAFTGLQANTRYTFYQRVAETETTYASDASNALTVTTPKSEAYSVPKPVLVEATQTMVQLEQINAFEYSVDGKNWQDSATFTGLKLNTTYTFYQRVRETNAMSAGPASAGLIVTTKGKDENPNVPLAPGVVFTGSSKVTLLQIDGYEYKMGNGNWQSSPQFEGLEANTSYTFYQRIKETDTTKASATSKGTTVTTVNYGLSTTACHLLLRSYIEEKGTTQSNGRKAVTFWSGNYYYKLQLSDNGVFCSMEHYVKQSSLETEAVVAFSLFPDVRDIPITMLRVVYYNGSKIGTYEGTSSIDRATYDTDMDIPVDGNFEVGSQMYDLFNGEFKMLLLQVTLFAMEELNMNPYYLGFFELKNPTFEKNFCDNATDYHVGKQVLKNQYAATCEYDGYSGDYVCDHCGITSQYGKTIPDKGGHVYSGACDTDCNTCGWVKEVVHTYSDACDESCNVCGATRTTAHTYDTLCDAHCNECNAERKPPHVYDNSDDLFCNACGYERPPYTPGDLDGDDVVTDADAVHLLFYTFFPEDYALNQDCDFDGDGTVNDADAVYLLFYTFFPEDYPVV